MNTLGNDIFAGDRGIGVGTIGGETETRAVLFLHEAIHNTLGKDCVDPMSRLYRTNLGVDDHRWTYGGGATMVFYAGSCR